MAARLARGNALVVVERPSPWRLAGRAGTEGPLDLDIGKPCELDPRRREHLDELVGYGNNDCARGYGRDGAHRVLGQLERDVVLSALSAYGVSPAAKLVVADPIDRDAPVATRY